MTGPIAFLVGAADSFNVRATTMSIGRVLHSQFDIDLVATAQASQFGYEEYFSVYGTEQPDTAGGTVAALEGYLRSRTPRCVVNVTRPPLHGNIAAWFCQLHDIPFVYRYSGDRFYAQQVASGPLQRLKWLSLNNLVGRVPLILASRCIALGPVGKRRLVERGVDATRVGVLPPPIEPERFSESGSVADLGLPPERDVVLFVGRRSRLKGIETLETAIPEAVQRRDSLHFVFVGGGRDLELPADLSDHVTVVGPVAPSSMPEYYRAADVLVHPSLTESFGRVLVEALLCGTPVVARDAGDMPAITSNIFESTEELVKMLTTPESIATESAESFTPDALRPRYQAFFSQL